MRKMRNACKSLVEKYEGKKHLLNLVVDEKIMLEYMLGKYGGVMGTGCMWLRKGTSGVFL
jgi:hypothetical protein